MVRVIRLSPLTITNGEDWMRKKKRKKRITKSEKMRNNPGYEADPNNPNKRGVKDPRIGCTTGQLHSQIRSMLRKCWRNSSRRVFIQSVRFPYDGPAKFKFGVKCVACDRVMGQSEKAYDIKKDGTRTKHRKLVYEVDHIDGNPPFLDIESDLGAYAKSLLYGSMRILCRNCHSSHTTLQTKTRTLERAASAQERSE